jgi:HAD superfamily hydrolase (TIGR01484 family)
MNTAGGAEPMHRVIALDLDGTLLHSNGTVSRRTMLALAACLDRGTRLVIATARPPRAVVELLPSDFPSAPWICYNGAETHEKGQRIAQIPITPDILRRVLSALWVHAPDATISIEIDDELFANRPLKEPYIHQVVDLESVIDRLAAKVLFDATCCRDVEALRAGLAGACRVLITDHGRVGQVSHLLVSKARALAVVLERWGYAWTDVIAFGDDLNDVEMLVESGIGIAMANARPELKSVADHITLSNDEDGVALVLETLLNEDAGPLLRRRLG